MRFKWAVCQHPMTLIIKEDETSLERIPPYGAESFEAYCIKIRENLDYLKNHEYAKVCFETSILETLRVIEKHPEIKKDIIELIKKKRLSFVGGTYAQSHMQTLSSESNFRQLEEGLRCYKELFGTEISLYAVQEPGHHEQMPQLLQAFGIKIAALPAFTYSLIFLEEYELVSFMEIAWMKFTGERGMEQDQIDRICFTGGNEFARWKGLDGTETALYLIDPMRWCRKEDIRNEFKKDLYASPDVRLYLTDLLDFNPVIVAEARENAEFVLADEAIRDLYSRSDPGPGVRLYSYYSYLEGVKLDKAYVYNRLLENRILSGQALESFLLLNKSANLPDNYRDGLWNTILETQHHDICYPDAPLLQEWAYKKLVNLAKKADAVLENLKNSLEAYFVKKFQADSIGDTAGSIIIFNSEPHEIKSVARVEIPAEIRDHKLCARDQEGKIIDCQFERDGRQNFLVFSAKVNGLGAKTLNLTEAIPTAEVKDKFFGKVENRHYSCLVDGSGELENIFIKKTGKVLFEQPANGLAASLNDGSEVEFKINPGETSFERGPVYDLFKTGGNFAESSFKKQIRFYREISRIDFKITFNFINQQIGDFFLEEKKLCATWPVGSLKTMKHDIPFGAVKAKKSRPLYALNWLNIEMESGAFFTLLPKGKIKFFEKDGILYNLLAWGDEGVDFMRVGGTCSPEILQGHFDLRLNGEYVVEYALYIHENKPLSSDLFKIAYSYSRPFIAVYTRQELKAVEDTVLKFQNSNVSSTSVIRQNNKIVCRFFETDGMEKDIKLITDSNVIQADITDIYGRKVKKTSPFRIAHLNINRREN